MSKLLPKRKEIKSVVYSADKNPWQEIRKDILRIENQQFGKKAFKEDKFIKDFGDSEIVCIFLFNKRSRKIIGFTYALPLKKRKVRTCLIYDTAIETKHQRRGLVGVMMKKLEGELKKRGYRYVERYTRVANNYASNIEKVYKSRVIEQKGPLKSPWGPQIFFKIKL